MRKAFANTKLYDLEFAEKAVQLCARTQHLLRSQLEAVTTPMGVAAVAAVVPVPDSLAQEEKTLKVAEYLPLGLPLRLD